MTSTAAAALERQILDALPTTIYTVDLDGRITFVNRSWGRFARASGAPRFADDIEGASIWETMREIAPREQIERAFVQLREGRAPAISWELPRTSPADERVLLLQIAPLHDGHAVNGFVFSVIDVSSSLHSREVLVETGMALSHAISVDRVLIEVASQLRRAMAADAVAIALADHDADSLSLAYASGFELETPEVEAALRPVWREVMTDGTTITRDAFGAQETSVPITNGDRRAPRGVISVVAPPSADPRARDESQRVLAVIAAQTGAALTRADFVRHIAQKRRLEGIGEVAAGVAHELRNPLFGISSAAQLLRFRVKEDPVVEKNVGRILREVERLNIMVTSLLEYGRPAPTRLAPADPDEVWNDVLEVQRGLLESKALIIRRTTPQPRTLCHLDAEQMAQVFVNVLMNAVDAAPEGTDLTLTSTAHGNGTWRCRLHNDGAAIPADVLARAFEIFYSTKPGGTGIGLALCQRIIEEHGGAIQLESGADQGTTLTITVPTA